MNNYTNSSEEVIECPLCMEPLEIDDLNFFPCTCGYQICRFCWHRIRTDENELCPACRKEYPENPADFKPLTQEEIIALKSQKRQKDQQRKQKITENRKHLANVRVVQKNLVFVVGLPPRLADADLLRKHEYFGKYGKIHKVVINPSTAYAGLQGPSASAYVTYIHNNDALRAIQSVNNVMIDGRLIKTSLGTTKYCSHFMKNQQCPKNDCMYLHELGDTEASFTKEEMHQGKHQEYEKRLHDNLIATFGSSSTTGVTQSIVNPNSTSPFSTQNIRNTDANKSISNNTVVTTCRSSPVLTSTSSSSSSSSSSNNMPTSGILIAEKEVWPSLSVSPVNSKDVNILNNKSRKDKSQKSEKVKVEKNAKSKFKINQNSQANQNSSNTNMSHKESNSQNNISTVSTSENHSNNSDQYYSTNKIPTMEKNQNSAIELKQNEFEKCKTYEIGNDGKSEVDKFNDSNNDSDKEYDIKNEDSRSNSSVSNISNCSANSLGLLECTSNVSECLSETSSLGALSETTSKINITSKVQDIKTIHGQNNKCGDYLNETQINVEESDSKYDDIVTSSVETPLSKLHIADESNSLFAYDSSMELCTDSKNNIACESRSNQFDGIISSHLPDLLNGIDGHQNSASKPKDLLSHNLNLVQGNSDFDRVHPSMQQSINQIMQQGPYPGDNLINFEGNMSKFFDFHKNQQLSQQFLFNHQMPHSTTNLSEQIRLSNILETNRLKSQFFDQGVLNGQVQKQKLYGKMDSMQQGVQSSNQLNITNVQHSQQPSQPSTSSNHYPIVSPADDELGFDPFIETQKALAELMENELQQKNSNIVCNTSKTSQMNTMAHQQMFDNLQRTRMPPPGFNHMHSFQYGMNSVSNNKGPYPSNIGQSYQLQNTWGQNVDPLRQHYTRNETQLPENNKGYNNNDWTAMDPAILSLRQFPNFSQHSQPNIIHSDPYTAHISQQQNIAGFSPQSQQNILNNISNTLLNSQHLSQTQMSMSPNWLIGDPNYCYRNGINTLEKVSPPLPPGIYSNSQKPNVEI